MNDRKQLRVLQDAFLDRCLKDAAPLNDVLDELRITAATFARWMGQDDFRRRLRGLTRRLRQTRELQIQIASVQAAEMLAQTAQHATRSPNAVVRAACVDLIRLARDARGNNASRRGASPPAPTADDATPLSHPDLPPELAASLVRELSRDPDGLSRDDG